jgi:hypothetical protein
MECAKMALSTSGHPVRVPNQSTYGSAAASWGKPAATKTKTWARQMDAEAADIKRRIAFVERTIADFDRLAADLHREILIEEERANIHDPAHFAYPTYARASALRRDNLRRSADELRAQLANAKKELLAILD